MKTAIRLAAVMLFVGAAPVLAAGAGSGHGTGDDASGQKLPSPNGPPLVQLTADSDTKTAKLSLTFNVHNDQHLDFLGNPAHSIFLSLTGSTPVGQGASYTNLATLDDLTSATALKLKFLYVSNSFTKKKDRSDPDYQSVCHAALPKIPENQQCVASLDIRARLKQLQTEEQKSEETLQDPTIVGDARNQAIDKFRADKAEEKALKQAQDTLNQMATAKATHMFLFGVNGQVGYDLHKYYDPTTLNMGSATKVPFNLGIEGTWVLDSGNASLNLSFNYQNAFKDNGSSQTQCKTTTAPITNCVNGFIGAPGHTERDLIGFNARWIPKPFGFPIGFNPGVTYDAKANSEAFQFPVYLLTNSSGGLSGGVRYDWTSEKHISVVGIFASAAFGIADAQGDN